MLDGVTGASMLENLSTDRVSCGVGLVRRGPDSSFWLRSLSICRESWMLISLVLAFGSNLAWILSASDDGFWLLYSSFCRSKALLASSSSVVASLSSPRTLISSERELSSICLRDSTSSVADFKFLSSLFLSSSNLALSLSI